MHGRGRFVSFGVATDKVYQRLNDAGMMILMLFSDTNYISSMLLDEDF